MTKNLFNITLEHPDDAETVEELNAMAFGPGRFTLTAYRLREQAEPVPDLCFCAWVNGTCIGSIRHSLVTIHGNHGLLLGPLVVHPDHKNQGCGFALIDRAMTRAAELDYEWTILVGDESYYARSGFRRVAMGQVTFPGPVDPARILVRGLKVHSTDDLQGMVRPGISGLP